MKYLRFLFLSILLPITAFAQQPVYTLYYSNPLAVNPAFAGSAHKFRAGVNFRNQWSNFNTSLTAYSVYADNFFPAAASSVGLLIYSDQAGAANYRSTRVSGFYAYTLKAGDNIYLKAGAEPVLGFTSMDQSSLIFNDQLSATGPSNAQSAENLQGIKTTYLNLNGGLLLTANNFWFGASAYNLLRPRISLSEQSRLPVGFGFQSGIKIDFMANVVSRREKKERFLMPHVAFINVGYSKIAFAGAELAYEPFSFSLTLKGNYFSKVQGTVNTTSAAVSIGFRKKSVHAVYTYDIPLSNKTSILGPSHEIGIRTMFKLWQRPTRRPVERLDLF